MERLDSPVLVERDEGGGGGGGIRSRFDLPAHKRLHRAMFAMFQVVSKLRDSRPGQAGRRILEEISGSVARKIPRRPDVVDAPAIAAPLLSFKFHSIYIPLFPLSCVEKMVLEKYL